MLTQYILLSKEKWWTGEEQQHLCNSGPDALSSLEEVGLLQIPGPVVCVSCICIACMSLSHLRHLWQCIQKWVDKHMESNHFSQQLVSGVFRLLEDLWTTCVPLKSCLGLSISWDVVTVRVCALSPWLMWKNVTYLKLLPLWVKLDGNNSHLLGEDSLPQLP